MCATTLFTVLLGLQPPPDIPTEPTFAPVRAELKTDERGLEIIAYDEHDEVVGALVATPNDDHIRIEADFDDAYASIALTLGPDEPVENLQSDLDPHVVAARITEMFVLVPGIALPGSDPLTAPTHQDCVTAFAAVAATCGFAAMYPPAAIGLGLGCVLGFAKSLCECGDYLPIDLC